MKLLILLLAMMTSWCLANESSPARHAISLYGTPKYTEDFKHFGYVNPDAPKGGELTQAVLGQFHTLNPYVDKGSAAAGSHYQFDTLLQRSWDEPLSKYGLIAERIELSPNRDWVIFYINPKAHFHDGKSVTANDVKFTFDFLREKGSTFYRHFYRDIKGATVLDKLKIQFSFKTDKNRELPLILGQMPILPMHHWKEGMDGMSSMKPMIGSGPYKVHKVLPGRSITYVRDPDYWGRDLPVNRGRHNFDYLRFEYYRDNTVALEGLFNDEYDVKLIKDPRVWHNKLTDDLLNKHHLVKAQVTDGNPQTLVMVYNTRKKLLRDIRIRESIGYAFNFEQLNKNQFMGSYVRAHSYFAGTELASSGLPSEAELKWLNPWKEELPKELFKEPFIVPGSRQGVGDRFKRSLALKLLKQAGWHIKNNQQVNKYGDPLELNALVSSPEHERVMLSLRDGLKYLGITLNIQSVDPLLYVERLRDLDFELTLHTFHHTASPGTEQASFWGSHTANQHASRNLSGATLPVLNHLTSLIPTANSRAELVSMTQAMDRVLLWQHYALPLWYQPEWNFVRHVKIKTPSANAPYALDMSTWWYDE